MNNLTNEDIFLTPSQMIELYRIKKKYEEENKKIKEGITSGRNIWGYLEIDESM